MPKERKLYEHICDYCGKEHFITSDQKNNLLNGKQKKSYCSKECANNAKRTGHNVECTNCKKIFYRRQYHIDKQENQFCCQKCQLEYQHKLTYETRFCDNCGEPFECSKKSNQRFCSQKCNSEWQKTIVGELNPQYNRIPCACDYCGREIKIKPSRKRLNNHNFCNEKCRQAWYAEIYSQTDKYREKCRKRAISQLKNNYFETNTRPQMIINSILDDLGIKYENEKNYTYYAVDNYLCDYNLIIEVMGDYWHSNPYVFDNDKLNNIQLNRIPKDKSKHSYIKNNYNIEILYLWESDIIDNPELCKMLIKQYINSDGILENYNSFNYSNVGENILLKENIIIPYQDMNSCEYKKIS